MRKSISLIAILVLGVSLVFSNAKIDENNKVNSENSKVNFKLVIRTERKELEEKLELYKRKIFIKITWCNSSIR